MSWKTRTLKSGNSFEQDVDVMLVGLGYVPIKKYQHEGIPVDDPNGKIRRLYPDSVVDVVHPIPNQLPWIVRKVVLADGWIWHGRTLNDDKETQRKDALYVAADCYPVHISDFHFRNEKAKAELRPLLDAAMKSTKPIEDLAN